MSPHSLAEAFQAFVAADPFAEALVTTAYDGDARLTRRELEERVLDQVGALAAIGVRAGDRVILALLASTDFVSLFWALQMLGVAAVPVPSLEPGSALTERRRRLRSVCVTANPALVIVDDDVAKDVRDIVTCCILSPRQLSAERRSGTASIPDAESIGVIQFTSGSTGDPRGCVLSQRALLANARAVNARCAAAPGDTAVSWLPVFHDMGLMTGVIAPVVAGARSCLRQTSRFMFNPLSWLRDLATFPGAHTAVPNFALAMVLHRLSRRPLGDIDLNGVKSIVCGAEPIDPDLVCKFLDRLASVGLRPEAFQAAYGLAEATLLVTSRPGGLAVSSFDRHILQFDGRADAGYGQTAIAMVSLGLPAPGVDVEIADANGQCVGERRLGLVRARSSAMMTGYFADAAATNQVLSDGWLTTQDLGFTVDGELFLTGRASERILVAGRNIAPTDIEASVSRELNISSHAVAAFGAAGRLGTEEIHVVVEYRDAEDPAALANTVRAACIASCGVTAHGVHQVRPGFLPRTTSGKVRRGELRKIWLADPSRFGSIAASAHLERWPVEEERYASR